MAKTIYDSATTLVRRTLWGEQPAISKSLKAAGVTPNAVARYHHEFNVNQSLTSSYVCRALALEEGDGAGPVIFFEDVGGEALRNLIADGELEYEDKLEISIALTGALQSIHDEGVIHRDLNPGNVVICEDPLQVYLIDFGLASLTPREVPTGDQLHQLTGTLPYLSPEQTGRVNRVVDYRTDLYSLGATLYELFAGEPPFTSTDPLELIHAHIASTPKALAARSPGLPRWLSEIVHKLLAKQPEHRYQSAQAVRDDLEAGQHHNNVIPFRLGRTDAPGQPALPKRLYGRDDVLERVRESLERITRGELLFLQITGAEGIGKSALAEELLRRARDKQMLTARVDAAGMVFADTDTLWLEICRQLVRQLLSLGGNDGELLVHRIQRLDSPHVRALTNDVPELASVVGTGSGEAGLPGKGIRQLLQALSPRPLCLIVERADRVPDECLTALTDYAREARHLLLVITREHEHETLFADPRLATKSRHLELGLLDRNAIRALLADMLSQPEARVRELASEVHAKTDGLPSDVIELIFELHQEGALAYDPERADWQWDMARIRSHYFSNNSRDRVRRQFLALPAATRRALQIGSAIGDQFGLALVAALLAETDGNAAGALRVAVTEALVIAPPSNDVTPFGTYQFSHPRLRALIY